MVKLVSVIMSLYKPNESFLIKQLDSINTQDYPNIEVIVYNDYPQDQNREKLLLDHISNFPLYYYHGSTNLGYIKSFEKLSLLAQGDYIAFSDQDDIWLSNRISEGIRPLNNGIILSSCDRAIIDTEDNITIPSWKIAHPKSPETNWKTGDNITPNAAFTCYSIGMATIIHSQIAKQATPFPTCVGHDTWITLYASQVGECAFIDEALVQYRRHGNNVTGLFSGISSKTDWYTKRIEPSFELAQDFQKRFPNSENSEIITSFALARLCRNRKGLRHHKKIAPLLARFEIVQSLTPNFLFKIFVKMCKRLA